MDGFVVRVDEANQRAYKSELTYNFNLPRRLEKKTGNFWVLCTTRYWFTVVICRGDKVEAWFCAIIERFLLYTKREKSTLKINEKISFRKLRSNLKFIKCGKEQKQKLRFKSNLFFLSVLAFFTSLSHTHTYILIRS